MPYSNTHEVTSSPLGFTDACSTPSFCVTSRAACSLMVAPLTNAQAPPREPLSSAPPSKAVLPFDASATLAPNSPLPVSPRAVSFSPCWLHFSPACVNTHAAPSPGTPSSLWLSQGPPINASWPLEDSATLWPNWASRPDSPSAVSFSPCWLHFLPERVNTQAAPVPGPKPWALLSHGAPTIAVLPSDESATLRPNWPSPISPVGTDSRALLTPRFTRPRERVHGPGSPACPISSSIGAPISAVVPAADRAMLQPNCPPSAPVQHSPLAVIFAPCCDHLPAERVNAHTAPSTIVVPTVSLGAPTIAKFPSAESATATPKPGCGDVSSLPVSFGPCCAQVLPVRVKTQAAPLPLLSPEPPMRAVFPSADSATDEPKKGLPTPSEPFRGGPC